MAPARQSTIAGGTAAHRVLGTVELMEHILLHLPLRDLLLLGQRLNRATLDVFKGSCAIQRALFLKAIEQPLDRAPRKQILNPFIRVARLSNVSEEEVGYELDINFAIFTSGNAISGFACFRQSTDVPRPTIGLDIMLLTQPSTGPLSVIDADDFCEATLGSAADVTHGELLDYCTGRWEGISRHMHTKVKAGKLETRYITRAVCIIRGAWRWDRLKRGVDEITGHEMLVILDTGGEKTSDEIRCAGESESEDDEAEDE